MPITPDDQPSSNGADMERDAQAARPDDDFDADTVEDNNDGQMAGWCDELGDYVAANPLKAVAISFMTGWVASRVLW